METIVIGFLVILASGALVLNFALAPGRLSALKGLLAGESALPSPTDSRGRIELESSGSLFERIKRITRRGLLSDQRAEKEDRFFQAGMFTDSGKRLFALSTIVSPIAGIIIGFLSLLSFGADIAILGAGLGLLLGTQIPKSWLTRRIARRNDDIMYFLPLVIEQIVIGVSSSLDVGPCIQRVVSMADERDTHNVVSELLRHTQNLARSGIPLDEALTEVGRLSGNTELKHAFISLGQVSRHGGEISRQLQELANAVAGQRETKIEAKIRTLELEATGPVGLVFLAFLSLLLIGIGMQVIKAV